MCWVDSRDVAEVAAIAMTGDELAYGLGSAKLADCLCQDLSTDYIAYCTNRVDGRLSGLSVVVGGCRPRGAVVAIYHVAHHG
jgi:hypothetical protein